jgi:tetratricopeptide (TPR) repeat protein
MYEVHPALPAYLAAAWQAGDPAYPADRAAATDALLVAHAALAKWLLTQVETGDAGLAFAVIGLERRTLGNFLGHALAHGLWPAAGSILQPLYAYWDARGLDAEARAWADRIRETTEAITGAPPPLDTPPGALWLYATGRQASRELGRHHLDRAEGAYRQLLTALQAMDKWPPQQGEMSATYHQLGRVAQRRGELDTAKDWCRKCLAISEGLGNRPGMASTYGQSALLAEQQGQLAEALAWMVRCVSLFDEIPHPSTGPGPRHLARLTSQLGTAALEDAWQAVTGGELPKAVHDYIASRNQEEGEPSGQ